MKMSVSGIVNVQYIGACPRQKLNLRWQWAIALFGTTSAAVLATIVGILTEVPVMLMLVRIVNKMKGRFL